MIDIGFIGAGGMGRHQAASFAQVRGCRVAAVADPVRPAAEALAADHGAAVHEDHGDLLASGIDAVVVAVPTGLHAAVAIDCLKAGVPVLVEKPMARTVAQCRAMNRVSESTGDPAHGRPLPALRLPLGDLGPGGAVRPSRLPGAVAGLLGPHGAGGAGSWTRSSAAAPSSTGRSTTTTSPT